MLKYTRKIFSPFLPVLVLVIILGKFVPPFYERAHRSLIYRFQLDGEEGFILNQALSIARGESIYQPIDRYPFLVGNYTPIYPALMSVFSGEKGISIPTGRLISVLSVAGILLLLFSVTLALTKNLVLPLLTPLLFLISYDNYEWIAYCRVDYLAIFFSIAGLSTVLISKGRPVGFITSIVMFFLAFYTKQIEVGAPLAVICWFLLRREKNLVLTYTLSLLIAVGTTFSGLMIATRGEVFRHLVIYNANVFNFRDMALMLLHFWRFNKFLIMVACIFLSLDVLRKIKPRIFQSLPLNSEYRLISIYFVIAMLSLIGLAKEGSAPNYFIEPEAAMALFVVLKAFEYTQLLKQKKSLFAFLLLVFFLCMLGGHSINLNHWSRALFSPHNPTSVDLAKANKVLRIIEEHPGDILSEYPIFNIMSNRAVLFQPFIMSALAKQKKWDPSPLLADIQKGRFALIITTTDVFQETYFFRWHPEIIKTIRSSYEPYQQIVSGSGINYFIYTPRAKVISS